MSRKVGYGITDGPVDGPIVDYALELEKANPDRQVAAPATRRDSTRSLYAAGKIDQAQALHAQMQWEQMSESLLLLERKEKVFAIRLNVLTGDPIENPIPQLEPLREHVPLSIRANWRKRISRCAFSATFSKRSSRAHRQGPTSIATKRTPSM
jgi:hypothetical protein